MPPWFMSWYSAKSVRWLPKYGALRLTVFSMVIGTAIMLPISAPWLLRQEVRYWAYGLAGPGIFRSTFHCLLLFHLGSCTEQDRRRPHGRVFQRHPDRRPGCRLGLVGRTPFSSTTDRWCGQ